MKKNDFVFVKPKFYSVLDDILTKSDLLELNHLENRKCELSEDDKKKMKDLKEREQETNKIKHIIREGNENLSDAAKYAEREKQFALDQYDRIGLRINIYFSVIAIVSTVIVSGLFLSDISTDIFFQREEDVSWLYIIVLSIYIVTLLYFLCTSIILMGIALLNVESTTTFTPTKALKNGSWAVNTLRKISKQSGDKNNWPVNKDIDKVRLYFFIRAIENSTKTVIYSNNYLRTLVGASFFQLTKAIIFILCFSFSVILDSLISQKIDAGCLILLIHIPIYFIPAAICLLKYDFGLIIALLDMLIYGTTRTEESDIILESVTEQEVKPQT